jgi:hypothetical protein
LLQFVYTPMGKKLGLEKAKAKATADPSLRLKNGYGQDDTVLVGEREFCPTHARKAAHEWGTLWSADAGERQLQILRLRSAQDDTSYFAYFACFLCLFWWVHGTLVLD